MATNGSSTPAAGGLAFRIGAVVLIVGGAMHSLAVLSAVFGEPQGELDAAYQQAARDLVFEIGPLRADAWGGTQILSTSYAILLFQVGLMDLLLLRAAVAAGQFRTLTLINLVATAAMLAISLAFQFPPPIVFMALALAGFAVSAVKQRTG